MPLSTEPIGSVPRPRELIESFGQFREGEISREELDRRIDEAVRDTIRRFEETGSPVVTDGEQAKPSFATYPVHGLENLAADGVEIPFADGHVRQLPRLVQGPFRYARYADRYLERAQRHADAPVKQAVISASALSLLYPPDQELDGYSREEFLEDLVEETAKDIRRCLEKGAHVVQMDFTEGRLSVKLDPSKGLLRSFVELNNRVLERFSEERGRLGIHTCPGGDRDSTHSGDVDYAELLPDLFRLEAGNFYIQLASETDRPRVLEAIREHAGGDQRIFVGVIDPIDPRVESPQEVRDRILEAAERIPVERLGTTDDCGFSPFADDTSTARDTAFAKIRARVEGTRLASEALGV